MQASRNSESAAGTSTQACRLFLFSRRTFARVISGLVQSMLRFRNASDERLSVRGSMFPKLNVLSSDEQPVEGDIIRRSDIFGDPLPVPD
jgi:hypothetical protein